MTRRLPDLASGLRWVAFISWTVLWISAALLVTLFGGRRMALVMARAVWAPGVLRIGRARLEVRGVENAMGTAGCLFAANHQSFLDVPALFVAIPRRLHFVAKRELAAIPFLGWYMRAVGMVFVDRRSPSSGVTGTRQVAELLAGGEAVSSFPAGTRSPDGSVQRFKGGAFAAAIEAGAAVIPVAISGAAEVMPARSLAVRSGVVTVAIGEPITTTGMSAGDRHRLAREVQGRVEELHRALRPPSSG